MFLDMACFFVGSNVTLPTHMWRSCDLLSEAGAEVLSLMSIIKIGDDKKIWVHDRFVDLAKEIVLGESIGKREETSRLWGLEARTLIINKQGSRKVEGIRLDCEVGSEPYVIPVETLEELVNLRYLDLGNAILDGNFQGILRRLLGCLGIFDRPLSNLRWLGWHGDTEFNIPPSISVKNLVVLDLSKSTVKETWTGWSLLKGAKKLEVVDLTACHRLKGTPDFSSFPRIQRLIFRDCINLETIHPSVGDLTNLISFDVRNCQGLRSLPKNLGCLEQLHELLLDESSIEAIPDISGLKSLEIFSAKSCKLLRRVPQSVGSLVKLRKLLLDNCESLVEISKTIGQLDLLQELSLSHTRVMDLPDPVVGKWSNLEVLNIDHCPVSSLPSSLGNLPKIQVMNFSGCMNLKGEFPFALQHLTTLRVLKLDHTNISSLPTTICMLSRLHTLDLEGCMKLQSLPSLPVSLVNLKVVVASSVAIPNPTELIKLEHIELQRHSSFTISEDPKHKATPSSDHVQTEYDHEVFLSFRGPDTRKNITNILYEMLTREDITTFIDSEDLHVGEKIDTLLEHINHSKISIPIISKDYAFSKWCLKEAAEIVKCVKDGRQKLYPIFYDVDPDEVKHQTGNYAKAFEKHVGSGEFDAQTIQEWRDALREIGSPKWLQLKVSTDNRSSEELSYIGTELRKVVSDIMNMLEKSPQLKVVDDLIGIEDPVAEITRKLDGDANNVKMLGIWGIAGIGKTTIAKSIFNRFAGQFKGHSSLENVRGTSLESGSLQSFKRQLFFDISKNKMDLAGSSVGMSALEARLKGKQLLILIDDVDTREQLDYLVGERDWFGMGSIIIVTIRQEEVLLDSRVVWSNYEVRPMNPHNAFCLFCKHAFHQETANVGFGNLSWDIVEATGRHPLALETIGRYLHSVNDVKVWQGATNILSTKKEIRDKLKISYDALSLAEQQIFLDIACFFQGTDKTVPMHMWNAQNFRADNAMVTLLRRGLVKIRDGSILWMHDLFIELGHEIVRQESGLILRNQTRLWSSEDTLKVLKRKMGTEKLKAIHLDCGSASGNCCFSHENFRNLSSLEFLRLGDANLDHNSNFEGCLSSLIWFSWQRRNLLDIPYSGLHLDNLIVLDLSKSLVEDGWNGWNCIKEARNLQVLNLTGCHQLLKTPDLSSFPDMERLILQDCQGLVEIDSSIGNLNSLKFLDVRNCQMLKRLPQELSGLLELTELLLDGSSIQNLPLSSDMKKLEIISAISCRSLTEISPAIWEQQSLKVLNFSSSGVVYIPDSIEGLTNLVELNIDHCLIGKLPQSLWKLRQLQVLNASGCRNLKGEIPPDLGSLKGLKVLRLDRTGVTSIPESISDLSLLHTLDLKDCMELQSLPTLPSSLTELKVTLKSDQIDPNLQELINLKELEIVYGGELSKILVYLDSFPKIEKLAITIKSQP